jgi:hemerythrin
LRTAFSARHPVSAIRSERNKLHMAGMIWNQEMSVGVKDLDDDHKELVALLNEMDEAIATGQGRDAINAIIGRLMESIKVHFAREEDFMAKSEFAGAVAHKREHDETLKAAVQWQEHFKDASSPVMLPESLNRFQSWLDNHIQGADMQYGPHLNAKGIH